MAIVDALSEGVRIALRNWPVLIIDLVVALVNCAGFFIFVLLPVAAILLVAGLSPFIVADLHSHEALIRQIPWVMSLALAFLLLYTAVMLCLGLFVLAGTVGVVVRTVESPEEGFSLASFLSLAKRDFFPFLNYSALTGGIGILIALFALVGGYFIKNLLDYLKGYSLALSYFVGIFAAGVGAALILALIVWLLSVTFYGFIELSHNRQGVMETFQKVQSFIKKDASSVVFFLIAGGIYLLLNLVFTALGFTFRFTPFGLLLTLPYQFLTYMVSALTGLWFVSSLVSYYLGGREQGVGGS